MSSGLNSKPGSNSILTLIPKFSLLTLAMGLLALGISKAQAEPALSYQPALGDYQRFEQDSPQADMPPPSQSHADHAPDAHQATQPDPADKPQHEHHHTHHEQE